MQQLKLKPVKQVKVAISGVHQTRPEDLYDLVKVIIQMGKRYVNIEAIVYDQLKTQIHTPDLQAIARGVGHKVRLANYFSSDIVGDIAMLIGGDNYHKFVTGLEKVDNINTVVMLGAI